MPTADCRLLQENGDQLLQEDGSFLVLDGCVPTVCILLQENGDGILQEDGSFILLDGCPPILPAVPPTELSPPGGSGRAANPRAQAMREADRLRRERILRDDEEVLLLTC